MAHLVIHAPDAAPQTVLLEGRGVVLGRDEAADVVLADPRASARHARLRPTEDGAWVLRDLGSTSGTLRGSERVLRCLLADGDELVLGLTRVVFRAGRPQAQAAAPIVGGTLALKPVSVPPPPAASTAPPAPPPPPAPGSAGGEAGRREGAAPVVADARHVRQGLVLLGVGLAALIAVLLALGPRAERARERAGELRDLRAVLAQQDLAFEAFQAEMGAFLVAHPGLPERPSLERWLEALRRSEAERAARQARLVGFMQDLYGLPESEARGALLELAASLPRDEDFARQVALALLSLDRRHESAESAALDVLLQTAESLVAAGDPAGALRRLTAFRKAWPAASPENTQRLRAAEDRTIEAVRVLAESAVAQAQAAPDAATARRILAQAWRGLEGTPQADRIADELRYVRPASRAPGTTPSGVPPTPTEEPEGDPAVLVRAAAAEDLARARQWGTAREAFAKLAAESQPGLLHDEWTTRAREMGWILTLVDALAEATQGPRPVRVKLPRGRVTVVAAGGDGVELAGDGGEQKLGWDQVPDEDLFELLAPARPTATERLGLAVLAASLSRRTDVEAVLIPLLEKGESVAEASGVVARYLYGRASPPPDGYRVYEGEILDPASYERRLKEARIVALRAEALKVFARLEKESAFKKLDKLREMRASLDERRLSALKAIFNETHYPYPAVKSSRQYQAVQNEIDRRVALVAEVWDDPYKLTLQRKGTLGRALDDWDEAVEELRGLGADVTDLEAKIEPFVTYVTGEPISIREFWRDAREKKRMAYNRWVLDVYNPQQTLVATEPERQQVRVTNDYRMMLGYAVVVTPGPASYEAIDDSTVAKILDEARIAGQPTPLLALRIDDRLVHAARSHSLDMAKRGFFAHVAPANEATGDPPTSPFDRMQKAGYQGGGASENIANGASSPEQAHGMWIHSSGHHRNILSPWADQGVGQAGRLWTQNFGVGGGAETKIPAASSPSSDRSGDDGRRDR